MSEKRMLIVPAELVEKINENRGDMSQGEFIDFLINSQLKEKVKEQKYVTKKDIQRFEQDIKQLLKSFLDFFLSYGLELDKQSPKIELEELTSKLKGLEDDLASENEEKEAKIKWKVD